MTTEKPATEEETIIVRAIIYPKRSQVCFKNIKAEHAFKEWNCLLHLRAFVQKEVEAMSDKTARRFMDVATEHRREWEQQAVEKARKEWEIAQKIGTPDWDTLIKTKQQEAVEKALAQAEDNFKCREIAAYELGLSEHTDNEKKAVEKENDKFANLIRKWMKEGKIQIKPSAILEFEEYRKG